MTNDDRQPFAKTLAALAAAYDFEADEAVAEGFWLTLHDLPLGRVQAAIFHLMKTSKFRPKAAEVREIVVAELNRDREQLAHQQRISRGFATGTAYVIHRDRKRAGASDDEIRAELQRESERLGIPLYWPGEEPWAEERRMELRIA